MKCKDNVDVDGTGLRDKNGYTVYVKGTMFNIPTIRYIFTYYVMFSSTPEYDIVHFFIL